MSRLQVLLLTAPVMLIAIVFHECAHGWVSDKLGDPTPRASGRLSLNPLRHIDPVGAICMLFFHFGWAKPVPVNPWYYKNRSAGLIGVALAGPLTNLILAFFSLLFEALVMRFAPSLSGPAQIAAAMFSVSATLNCSLAVFNLIPLPPLDGSRILGGFVPSYERFYMRYARVFQVILLVCLFTGVFSRTLGVVTDAILDGMWSVIVALLFH